jgi:hypothetical protein
LVYAHMTDHKASVGDLVMLHPDFAGEGWAYVYSIGIVCRANDCSMGGTHTMSIMLNDGSVHNVMMLYYIVVS